MYTIHKELFIYTTLNICKQKHVFLYEDSSNKTSEDNDEYELFAEVFKRDTLFSRLLFLRVKFLLANENCLPLTNLLLLSSLKKHVLLFTNIQCCVLYTSIQYKAIFER
jgi:hypothetical protein